MKNVTLERSSFQRRFVTTVLYARGTEKCIIDYIFTRKKEKEEGEY